MEPTIPEDLQLRDVFVSHSWGDKKQFIDPLVAALEAEGMSCWYDLTEIRPGDSLYDRINYGLTHSKLVLLCLSENFFLGKWSVDEMKAAIGLGKVEGSRTRIVPVMLDDPPSLIARYPLMLADTVYLRWNDDLDELADGIRGVLSDVDGIDLPYWLGQAEDAYREEDFVRSTLYAKKALSSNDKHYTANMYLLASLIHLGRFHAACQVIHSKEFEWPYLADDTVPADVLDYVQDSVSNLVVGDEVDDSTFQFAVVDLFITNVNSENAWKYAIRLFDKDKFAFHRDKLVRIASVLGKDQALEWLKRVCETIYDKKVREAVAESLTILAFSTKSSQSDALALLRELNDGDNEDIRSITLMPLYLLAPDGPERAVSALKDKSPIVRGMAFELLAGLYDKGIDENGEMIDDVERERSPLLTEDHIVDMLHDPDDMIFEHVVDTVLEGKLECPAGIDLMNLPRPPSEEIREGRIRQYASMGTDEARENLLKSAREDPGQTVRESAYEALEESDWDFTDEELRELWQNESVDDAKDELVDLVLKKGHRDLLDIYMYVLDRNLESDWTAERAFRQITRWGTDEDIVRAADTCRRAGKESIIADSLTELVDRGALEAATSTVRWCFANDKETEESILCAGKLPKISDEEIEQFLQSDGAKVHKANALRSLEYRHRDGAHLESARELLNDLMDRVSDWDGDEHWAMLSAIDGILEFGDRNEAIEALKDYYERATAVQEGSFPIRAAWERLRRLGHEIKHPNYDPEDAERPWPWPYETGPFFRKDLLV